MVFSNSTSLSSWAVGLEDTEWPGRTQTLKHGPVTYFLDGAHTTRSMLACVSWFSEVASQHERTTGSVSACEFVLHYVCVVLSIVVYAPYYLLSSAIQAKSVS